MAARFCFVLAPDARTRSARAWRNGRRKGLKIPRERSRAGSSPAARTSRRSNSNARKSQPPCEGWRVSQARWGGGARLENPERCDHAREDEVGGELTWLQPSSRSRA